MKICVTSEGNNLDAVVDQRFGRCAYFIFVDTDTMEYESVENTNVSASGGVGIKSAQLVSEKGARVVLTGKVGPNAAKALEAAGIEVITDVSGSVKDAIERYKEGRRGA